MRKIVFVVGMHRSGTSAVSGALAHCGLSHGAALMPAKPDNPDGFFEQIPVVRLNERLLAMAGARWDFAPLTADFRTLSPRPFGEWCAAIEGTAASDAWDAAFDKVEGDLVVKDPRFALTLPLWLKTAEEKGFAAEVILMHRDPLAIIASLSGRNGTEFSQAAELVTDYWLEMVTNAPDGARVVSYEAFAGNPVGTLTALGYPPQDAVALQRFVRKPKPATSLPVAVLPEPLRSLNMMLGACAGGLLGRDRNELARLAAERESRKRYAGAVTLLADPPMVAPATLRHGALRTVVLHCHIFKNAGTSVDVILRAHFRERWVSREFPVRPLISNADLTNAFVRSDDRIAALSTHTGDWWLGHGKDRLHVLPIIFLRHPIVRIRSAYDFERKQQADTIGARLAKEHSFAGYVKARLAEPNDLSFRDFQARRFATFRSRVVVNLRSAALAALDEIPYLGLVEEFEQSARKLEEYLKPHVPGITIHNARANVTDTSERSLDEKIAAIYDELGPTLSEELVEANAVDLELYDAGVRVFNASSLTAAA
jgi:hypothetical protein